MSLLNWLGVVWLALVPILALIYMLRPRRRPTVVPSLRLWRALPYVERSTSHLRLPPLSLLLILQAILLVAGALALARPALTAPIGGLQVVAVDASGSMLAATDGATRFQQAKDQARQAVATMSAEDKATLLRVGANVTTACSACDPTAFLRALDNMQPGAGTADILGMLDLASGLSHRLGDSSALPLTIISDGEFVAPPTDSFPALALRFVKVGDSTSGDELAVVALSARRPPDGRTGWIAFARIENRSTKSAQITVKAMSDNVPLPDRAQSVPAGGSVGMTWQVSAGTVRFIVSVSPGDALPEDDHATIFLPVAGQTKVLVSSPQPDLYTRALEVIDGVGVVTGTTDDPRPTTEYALTVIEGAPPEQLPSGGLLLVDPTGGLDLKLIGKASDVRAVVVNSDHPLLAGMDLSALLVSDANQVQTPDWLETLVDSSAGPLLLAGEKDGRRIVVLTFDPSKSNLPKLAAFPLLMANITDWLYPLANMQSVPPGTVLRVASGTVVTTPDGRTVNTGDTGLFLDTDQAGIYKLTGGAQFAVNVADNGSATASDAAHPELSRPLTGNGSEQGHNEVWFALAGVALALLMSEWLVYCWKRGSA